MQNNAMTAQCVSPALKAMHADALADPLAANLLQNKSEIGGSAGVSIDQCMRFESFRTDVGTGACLRDLTSVRALRCPLA